MNKAKAKSKATFPKTVTVKGVPGITATIYKQTRRKGEANYVSLILVYSPLGKRKMEAYSDLARAEEAGADAIKRIAEGQQSILELSNRERDAYLRSKEYLAPVNVDIETACREDAEVRAILTAAGRRLRLPAFHEAPRQGTPAHQSRRRREEIP